MFSPPHADYFTKWPQAYMLSQTKKQRRSRPCMVGGMFSWRTGNHAQWPGEELSVLCVFLFERIPGHAQDTHLPPAAPEWRVGGKIPWHHGCNTSIIGINNLPLVLMALDLILYARSAHGERAFTPVELAFGRPPESPERARMHPGLTGSDGSPPWSA